MATPYERLVEAGAPEIEEPFFYRVKFAPDSDNLVVELRRRNARFGSARLASKLVRTVDHAADDMLPAVVAALWEITVEHEVAAEAVEAAERLVGDYREPRA